MRLTSCRPSPSWPNDSLLRSYNGSSFTSSGVRARTCSTRPRAWFPSPLSFDCWRRFRPSSPPIDSLAAAMFSPGQRIPTRIQWSKPFSWTIQYGPVFWAWRVTAASPLEKNCLGREMRRRIAGGQSVCMTGSLTGRSGVRKQDSYTANRAPTTIPRPIAIASATG